MKTIIKAAIVGGIAAFIGFLAWNSAAAATLQGFQGGTGFASSTSSTVGQYLQVASTSPFLTYQFAAASGGGGSTTTINGVQGPTFTFSIVNTSTASSITTTTAQIFLNLLRYTSTSNINVSATGSITFVNTNFVQATGTTNSIPIYTSATTLGTSSLSQIGGTTFLGANAIFDGNGDYIGPNIFMGVTTTAVLGNANFQGGVQLITTSTQLSQAQFCSGGLFVVASTTGTTTITLPTMAQINSSTCGPLWSSALNLNFLYNSSTGNVIESPSGTNEQFFYSPGTPSVLAPGQAWWIAGQFVNTSTVQGAVSTMLFVNQTIYQTSTPFTVNGSTVTVTGILQDGSGNKYSTSTGGGGGGSGNLFVTPSSSVVALNFPFYLSGGSPNVSPTSSLSQVTSSAYIHTAQGLTVNNTSSSYEPYTFSVIGTNTSTNVGDLGVMGFANTGNTTGSTMGFQMGQAPVGNTAIQTVAEIGLVGVSHTNGAQSGAVTFATRNSGAFSEKMRLQSTGDLTIGSTTDCGIFCVVNASGTQVITAASTTNNNLSVTLMSATTSTLTISSSGLASIIGPSSTIRIGTAQANPGCIELFDAANGAQVYLYASSTALVVTASKPNFCR